MVDVLHIEGQLQNTSPLDNIISDGDVLLTRQQAAAYLNLSPQTLANWKRTRAEELPFVKIGQRTRYRKSDLDAFIRMHTPLGRAAMKPGLSIQSELARPLAVQQTIAQLRTLIHKASDDARQTRESA